MLKQIAYWYDGYHFSNVSPTEVYNPVSVLNLFAHPEDSFQTYWDNTGSSGPTFLQQVFQHQEFDFNPYVRLILPDSTIPASLSQLLIKIDQNLLDSTLAVLYQAGYLTIKQVFDNRNFLLGVPNNEVRVALKELIYGLLHSRYGQFSQKQAVNNLRLAITEDNPELFQKCFSSYFNSLFKSKAISCFNEDAYQGNLLAYFFFSDIEAGMERNVTSGRIDIWARSFDKQRGFVFELKVVKTQKEAAKAHERAREQILSRNYGELMDFKEVVGYTVVFIKPSSKEDSSNTAPSYMDKLLALLDIIDDASKAFEPAKASKRSESSEFSKSSELSGASEQSPQGANAQSPVKQGKTKKTPLRYKVEVQRLPELIYKCPYNNL